MSDPDRPVVVIMSLGGQGRVVLDVCLVLGWRVCGVLDVIFPGGVTCLDGAFVGAGAVALPGVTMGRRAVVGAGSVVTRACRTVSPSLATRQSPEVDRGSRIGMIARARSPDHQRARWYARRDVCRTAAPRRPAD
jgi:tetrahydrodipicolinate N-succinyltransferase